MADIGNGLDMGMAPVFAGILWDIANTYAAPLIMSLGFSLMGLVFALLLPSPRSRLIPDLGTPLTGERPFSKLAGIGIMIPGA